MGNIIHSSINAWRIFQIGYCNPGRKGSLDVKSYFEKLRDAVVDEYKTQGFCELIDCLLEEKSSLDELSYASFNDANQILCGYNNGSSENYIFYARMSGNESYWQQRTWYELATNLNQYSPIVYNFDKIYNFIYELRNSGRKYHIDLLKKYESSLIKPEKQADEKRGVAKSRGKKNYKNSKAESENRDAGHELSNNNRNECGIAVSIDVIKAILDRDRDQLRTSIGSDLAAVLNESREALGRSEAIHDDMCDQTNKLQAAWVQALNAAIEDITKIKDDFYERIHNWQVSLYPHELRPLAERYVELYRIINIDRLIAEELIQISGLKQNEETFNDSSYKSRQPKAGVSEITTNINEEKRKESELGTSPVIEGLKKLNKTLTTFLRKFEVSLNGLDMYVYFPKSGTGFDNVWHILEDDTDFDHTKEYVIKSCITPGVAKKVNDAGEDDVIIPAVVSV